MDVFSAWTVGRRFKDANGIEWTVVGTVRDAVYLAMRADDALPAQIYAVEDPEMAELLRKWKVGTKK